MHSLLIVPIAVFMTVWVLVYMVHRGKFKALGQRIILSGRGISLRAPGRNASHQPRRFEGIAFFVIAPICLALAHQVSCYLLLCFLYGASRVRHELLHIVDMPKGLPWTVSNGDQIGEDIKPLHFVLTASIWIFSTIAFYISARKLMISMTTKESRSQHRRKISIGIIVAMPFVLLGGCLSVDQIMLSAARPPKNLKTIQDFEAWKGGAILGTGTYENSGTNYTVFLSGAGRTLASGPSAYLFEQNGQFVDWTSDMGYFHTVKNRFDLTSGHVKNIEHKKP